jgi:alginate O-acetyltransferase complex protein AlgJ
MTDSAIRPNAPGTDDRSAPEHEGDEATVADALAASEGSEGANGSNGSERADGWDDDRAQAAGLASPRRARVVIVPLVAALVFFFGPALAFVLGDRAEELDNRPLADMPTASDGWTFFPDFTTWANDHLPLRSFAVEQGTELSEAMFDEPPPYGQASQPAPDGVQYPRVITGKDGWLYFGGDVSGSCNPQLAVDEIAGSLERLHTAIVASGRTVVLAIAPDKSTMVPEHLPDRYAGEDCASARKEAVWDALDASGVPLLDLRRPLAAAQDDLGDPLYRPTDSHWNLQGASVFVREAVRRLDPTLLAGEPFVEGPKVGLRGDLGRMLGTPTSDTVVGVTVERPGVSLAVGGATVDAADVPGMAAAPATVDASSTQAPLFPGRTVLFGDSFSGSARPLLAPFLDQLTLQHNQSAAPALAQTMVASDTVIIELVERSVVAGNANLATPAVVDVIERVLAASPRQP